VFRGISFESGKEAEYIERYDILSERLFVDNVADAAAAVVVVVVVAVAAAAAVVSALVAEARDSVSEVLAFVVPEWRLGKEDPWEVRKQLDDDSTRQSVRL